ncbi:hypothetical protein Talka_01957 [Tepidimonas alkaliphilus]|uniref:DUF4124 domain-containing protein n=1 Tax=Tepidimonas alkaliphilus TaxID=2588942 RepID=A0A554W508_9BURK|nr:DUF4124 domain-containing protein [Tepidimonas alkaliphilus]TSE18666.1 hypothetical protein Talka_01957 [Tepidimonas alkaliphilus]
MAAWAQTAGGSASIYTCIDAQGRLLSSDRPIPECRDRVQRELGPSGAVRRVLEPPPSAEERARAEAQQRAQAEAAARAAEAQRREQALLMRYPTPAAHQRAREAALAPVQASLQLAQQRLQQLEEEQRQLQQELERSRAASSQPPASVQRRLDDVRAQREVQRRFVADLERERARIDERFDAELAVLRRLWATPTGSSDASLPSAGR